MTVPGAVDGWAKLHERFGKLQWKGLFQPAIYYARNGYAVPEVIHEYWKLYATSIGDDAETKRLFLPGGKVPETGQVFKNPELAGSLELIANEGESAFYKGAIAQQILKTSQEHGGVMTAADLAGYLGRVGGSDLGEVSATGRCMNCLRMAMGLRRWRC